MDNKLEVFTRGSQFFFSDNFLMQLRFEENNTIAGWVVHYPIGLNLAEEFQGIFVEENALMKFSFFIEWSNPNLNGRVLTAYSGEIVKRERKETQLALEWLQVSEDQLRLGVDAYKGYEVLRGLSEKDPFSQARWLAFLDILEESLGRP